MSTVRVCERRSYKSDMICKNKQANDKVYNKRGTTQKNRVQIYKKTYKPRMAEMKANEVQMRARVISLGMCSRIMDTRVMNMNMNSIDVAVRFLHVDYVSPASVMYDRMIASPTAMNN